LSVLPSRFNPVVTFSTETSAPGTTAPLASVTVPNRVPSCVCADADAAISAANKKRNRAFLLFDGECVEVPIEAIIIYPTICFRAQGWSSWSAHDLNQGRVATACPARPSGSAQPSPLAPLVARSRASSFWRSKLCASVLTGRRRHWVPQ